MKKKHKRIWVFISLKIAELTGFIVVLIIGAVIIHLTKTYELAKYILGGIYCIIFSWCLYVIIVANWGWAGKIVNKRRERK